MHNRVVVVVANASEALQGSIDVANRESGFLGEIVLAKMAK